MKLKTILTAVVLVSVGVIFGVILITGFQGMLTGSAQDKPKIGNQKPTPVADPILESLNQSFTKMSELVTPSVVYINVRSTRQGSDNQSPFPFFNIPRGPQLGTGSGVIITENGFIITNNHVVQEADADGIRVILNDSREFRGRLIGTDETTDMAVIKIDAENLPVAYVGNSEEVKVGQLVFAVGNPLGLTSTVTMGIVSAIGRNIGIIADERGYGIENFIQTDAAINPGNSGGALVNIKGELVGINTAIASTNQRFQGYGFAIPINLAKRVASDLIAFGKVKRGYIGVRISTVDATIAKSVGLDKPQGVLVQSVNPGSAGEEAGVKAGDIILLVDGNEVNSSQSLQTLIASKYPGSKVELTVYRNKKRMKLVASLKGLDEESSATVTARNGTANERARSGASPIRSAEFKKLGFSVKSLDARTMTDLGVQNGVIVSWIEPFGEASARGLRTRDVIFEVNDEALTSVGELKQILDKMNPGDAIRLRVQRSKDTQFFVAMEMPE